MRSLYRMRTIIALIALTACAAPRPSADGTLAATQVVTDAARARIDSTLRSYAPGKVAGVSALVFEKGKEVYFGAFGMADREAARPMARDAIVQIFSMTKPLVGVALMTLYEQGKFKLDDPVAKYLPEFANVNVYAGADASGAPKLEVPHRAMTIRDLTRHTAGFATGDSPGVNALLRDADPGNRNNTLAQMAAKLGTVPLAFHPGEKWLYGPSVDVQAYLVERLSGQPFDRYLQEHVLGPLRMRDTRYVVADGDRSRFAAMYQRNDSTGVLTRQPDSTAKAFNSRKWPLTPGSYGLTSTLDDYMRFARMLLGGGSLDGVRVLKPETVRLMATSHLADSITDRSWLPSKGRVGFGIDFAVRTRPPANAEENNGVVGEFFWDGAASTLFWVDPANDLAAVLFVQLMPFDRVRLHKSFRDAVYGG